MKSEERFVSPTSRISGETSSSKLKDLIKRIWHLICKIYLSHQRAMSFQNAPSIHPSNYTYSTSIHPSAWKRIDKGEADLDQVQNAKFTLRWIHTEDKVQCCIVPVNQLVVGPANEAARTSKNTWEKEKEGKKETENSQNKLYLFYLGFKNYEFKEIILIIYDKKKKENVEARFTAKTLTPSKGGSELQHLLSALRW